MKSGREQGWDRVLVVAMIGGKGVAYGGCLVLDYIFEGELFGDLGGRGSWLGKLVCFKVRHLERMFVIQVGTRTVLDSAWSGRWW